METLGKSFQNNNSASNDSNDGAWWSPGYDFSNDAVVLRAADSVMPESQSPDQQKPKHGQVSFSENVEPAAKRRSSVEPPESPGPDQQRPKHGRLSFSENVERRSSVEPEEVLVCSSISSYPKKSSFIRSKTKSRLIDEPEEKHPRSQTQRLGKSHLLGKGTSTSEFDENDPFLDEDLPEDYKKVKYNNLSIIQLVCLILIIAALVCSLSIERLKNHSAVGLRLWKWEFMVLVLICGRLIAGWAIRIIVLLIEGNFLLRKRVLYFIYGLKSSAQNCVWLALVWIAWHCIFDEKIAKVANTQVLSYVSKIWVCLLVGTLIWLMKTLFAKVLASSFHVNTFFDRIQGALFNQYVMETLSGSPLIEIQQEQEEEEKVMVEVQKLESEGATIPHDLKANMFPRIIGTLNRTPTSKRPMSKKEEKNGISIDRLHRLNQKNISAWNMKRLTSTVRKEALSIIDEKIRGFTGEDEAVVHITSENQAKSAAKKIFFNVAKPGSKHIYLEDLVCFMREDDALKTLHLFDYGTDEKGITKRALKNWLVTAFRERRALALSLNDTKTAVNKMHHMLNVIVGILIVVVWLLILKVATSHFLVFLSSQALLVVFMFGNTCKTTFEAIIFLFVMHPFDVGDRVEVDDVQMIVEEMNILTTVFLKYDNHKIYYPNSVLCTKPIHNYYRSPDMGDSIDFCIHISTPGDKIATIRERITRYVNNRSDHWYSDPMIVMRDVEEMNKLKFSIWLSHKMNHQDMGERWTRRALVVEEMVKTFRELDIEYRMLPLDVNVRNINSGRLPSNWTVCAPT
ncbi:hypothetical protein ACS0TY_013986 [Phlomoides rotata]